MHFNSRELTHLATHCSSQHFDREGVLLIHEKQEGLFRKNDVFQERYCKLRGNLLFYHKSKDSGSELAGLWVLEQCIVNLEGPGDPPFTFYLVFQSPGASDDRQQLVAPSQGERDAWVQALHMANFQYVRSQLLTLQAALKKHRGGDSASSPNNAKNSEKRPLLPLAKQPRYLTSSAGHCHAYYHEPFLELCLACANLKGCGGLPPTTLVKVSVIVPPSNKWVDFSQTEIVEKNYNPCYMCTCALSKSDLREVAHLRLQVHYVKERVTATSTLLGECTFALHSLLRANRHLLSLPLVSPDFSHAGFMMVSARELHLPNDLQSSTLPPKPVPSTLSWFKGRRSLSLPSLAPGSSLSSLLGGSLWPVYSSYITQTYRLPSAFNAELRLLEVMAESPLSFTFPQHLLNLWIQEEKKLMGYIFHLGEVVSPEWQQRAAERHLHLIAVYTEALNALSSPQSNGDTAHLGSGDFKRSSHKADPSLECAPTNLHLQRMVAHNLHTNKVGVYDVITVGAFTAFCQGYKRGGLLKMLKPTSPLDRASGPSLFRSVGGQLSQAAEAINLIEHFQSDLERVLAELKNAACSCNGPSLSSLATRLHAKGQQLVAMCQARLPEDLGPLWDSLGSKVRPKDSAPSSSPSSSKASTPVTPCSLNGEDKGWTHIDDLEPMDLLYLNVRASVMCVASKASTLPRSDPGTDWWVELGPSVAKLRTALAGMHRTATAAYGLLALRQSPRSAALAHRVRWRRDIVFSQALTSLVCGVMTRVWSHGGGETARFVSRLRMAGCLLAQFEGLLSCHGDEQAMLEDMVVALADLSRVHFCLEPSTSLGCPQPRTEGNRAHLLVVIPAPEDVVPSGFQFTVTPAFFNMGINEYATLAEKLGTAGLQDKINHDGSSLLKQYYRKFVRMTSGKKGTGAGLAEIPGLLDQLAYQLASKKTKNVAILHLAAEITRQLGGLRFTSCKSAKDRTSMSVTLEQALILRRQFHLEEAALPRVLDATRSEGTRRENPLKNVGVRKYNFNKLQLYTIPPMYRPPPGTYGNVQS